MGYGIHWVQLLFLGSLVGPFLNDGPFHPKLINDLTINPSLIKQILRYAPRGLLPVGVLEIRAFNCYNWELESVVLERGT